MSIPKRYENVSYNNDVPNNIKSLLENITKIRKGIFLHGMVGTGKTHIAYALKKEWEERSGTICPFWNTTELLREIKDDFDRSLYDKTRIVERLMDSRMLLFLDDIGNEKATEFVQETFYLLVNRRYNEMRPIIFTSNYSIAELAARIGDRIASRIVEMSEIVRLDGVDKRLLK